MKKMKRVSSIDNPRIPVDKRAAMLVMGCKDVNRVSMYLKNIYLRGMADALHADIDDTDRFLRIKPDTEYQCVCPECGTEMVIDLMDLLERNGEENGK